MRGRRSSVFLRKRHAQMHGAVLHHTRKTRDAAVAIAVTNLDSPLVQNIRDAHRGVAVAAARGAVFLALAGVVRGVGGAGAEGVGGVAGRVVVFPEVFEADTPVVDLDVLVELTQTLVDHDGGELGAG